MQEQFFEQASKAMHEELKNQDSFQAAAPEEQREEDCAKLEQEVNRLAQTEAEQFMRKLGNCRENL